MSLRAQPHQFATKRFLATIRHGYMGPISSGLCSLPELFAFSSNQICASNCLHQSGCESCWGPTIVFSSTIATESLTEANNRFVSALSWSLV
jgi:hypothetical protein